MYILQAVGQASGNLTVRSTPSFQSLLSALMKNSELVVKRPLWANNLSAAGPTRSERGSESILKSLAVAHEEVRVALSLRWPSFFRASKLLARGSTSGRRRRLASSICLSWPLRGRQNGTESCQIPQTVGREKRGGAKVLVFNSRQANPCLSLPQ
jgi:hypothetical protein